MIPCSFQHNIESLKNLKLYDKYPSAFKCESGSVAMAVKEKWTFGLHLRSHICGEWYQMAI